MERVPCHANGRHPGFGNRKMEHQTIILLILGMAMVTYLPRVLPALLLSHRKMPELASSWLKYVPSAIVGTLLLPSLFLMDGALSLTSSNMFLWSAIPTFIVAFATKSLVITIFVGVAIASLAGLYL